VAATQLATIFKLNEQGFRPGRALLVLVPTLLAKGKPAAAQPARAGQAG